MNNLIDLYIDFDGVIMDTINVTYKMMEDKNISLKDSEKVFKFYNELDWNKLLLNTSQIDNACEKIKFIQDRKIFRICILTTVCSLQEMIAKLNFKNNNNLDINIIFVPKGAEKSQIVNANGAVLIDDYGGNIKNWNENNGIGFKFSKDISDKYETIRSLDEICSERCLSLIRRKKVC